MKTFKSRIKSMKKMRLAVVFAALTVMFGFTSCLDDNGGDSRSMGQEIVKVSGAAGFYSFRSFGGYTLNPTNQSALQEMALNSPYALVAYYYDPSTVTQGFTQLDVEMASASEVKSGTVELGEAPEGGGNLPVYAVLNDSRGVPLIAEKSILFLPVTYYYANSSDQTELASELNSHSFTLYYEGEESVNGRMRLELCHNVTDSTVTRTGVGTEYRYFNIASALGSYESQFGSSPREIIVEFEQASVGSVNGSMNSITFEYKTSE